MDLTVANVTKYGYIPPPPSGRSKVPQLRFLSSNDCPNSTPMWLTTPPPACSPDGMTTWGYCGVCWGEGYVPQVWVDRVTQEVARGPQ